MHPSAIFFLKWPLKRWAGHVEVLHGLQGIHYTIFGKKMARSGQMTERDFKRTPDYEAHHTLLQTNRDHTIFRSPLGTETFLVYQASS